MVSGVDKVVNIKHLDNNNNNNNNNNKYILIWRIYKAQCALK